MTPEIEAMLPEFCAAAHPSTGAAILIKRGESGYWPFDGASVDAFNARHGVSPNQREAMLIGSMFGWDVPGVRLELEYVQCAGKANPPPTCSA